MRKLTLKQSAYEGKGAYMRTPEERQQRDYERRQIIQKAVEAADRIILDGSDGSEEETNLLTAEVAGKFNEKVHIVFNSALMRKDLLG